MQGAAGRTYIVLGQEARAELEVVIEVKGATGLESRTEGRHSRGLCEFTHALDASELALGVLGGHLGATPGTSSVVVIRVHVGGRVVVRMLLMLLAVEKGRHGDDYAIKMNDIKPW